MRASAITAAAEGESATRILNEKSNHPIVKLLRFVLVRRRAAKNHLVVVSNG
jgi:hypothetical protein